MLRMMVVTSSNTPSSEVNSLLAPCRRSERTAAPWMLESSTRRRLLPMVVAKPRSKGSAWNLA